jgi:FMN phosphatase YigB (HAD superfamily)
LAGPAERLALIGDEAENDVAAPRAAGWVAVRVEGRGGLVAAVETVLGEAGISSS